MTEAGKTRGRLTALLGTACAVALLSLFAGEAQAYCVPGPEDRPEPGLQGATPRSELNEPGGFRGHWCGVRHIGQEALADRGSFGDIQLIGLCAYASMRDPSNLALPTTGTSVVDMRVPSQPVWTQTLRSPAMQRAYSALEIQQNIMVAAFKDFGPGGNNWFDIYDVSGNCLEPTLLSTSTTSSGNHDGWLTPDTKTYYGVPFGAPSGQSSDIRINPNRVDVHVTDLSDRRDPKHLLNWNRLQLPPDVQARTVGARNFHDVSTNDDGTRLYLALYGGNNALGGSDTTPPPPNASTCANGLLILDSSDVALRRPNPQLRYVSFLSWCDQQIDPDFGDGSTAAAHATEYVIHENGKEYILSTDESGDGLNGAAARICRHHTYGRLIDISDDRNPRVVSTFKPDANKPGNCEQNITNDIIAGMLHYIGFDDRYKMRLVFYAAANQGLRVVDYRDPEKPVEVAYYKAPNAARTAQGSMDFTRPDPRYDPDNCLIYTGWNQGGLRIVELTSPEYNGCMRRAVNGGGWLAGGGPRATFGFDAGRADGGHGALEGSFELHDRAANAKVKIERLTLLGSVRDACGAILPGANAVQFDGTGTYNGAPASFRVCVQDNGEGSKASGPDRLHVACTAGCSYTRDGALGGGNVQVTQR